MFIDLNGDGEIDGQEFFTLEHYGAWILRLSPHKEGANGCKSVVEGLFLDRLHAI